VSARGCAEARARRGGRAVRAEVLREVHEALRASGHALRGAVQRGRAADAEDGGPVAERGAVQRGARGGAKEAADLAAAAS